MSAQARRQVIQFSKAALVLALAVGVAVSFLPLPAQAHCDSIKGPVVTAAVNALGSGDVKLILPYVQPEAEAELTAAFEQALKVYKLGGESKALAERYFAETAVRLHRMGEGATYTGLKDEEPHPAIVAADKAMESGLPADLRTLVDDGFLKGFAAQYKTVQTTREEAAKAGTVEANRERVEAELIFEKWALGVYQAAEGTTIHAEGAPVAAHAE